MWSVLLARAVVRLPTPPRHACPPPPPPPPRPPSLVLHHYATKSREEFHVKMVRGSAMKRQRGWEFFDFVDGWSSDYNFDALRLWDDLTAFHHYPGVSQALLDSYRHESHEQHWGVKGAAQQQQQQQPRRH